MCERILFLDDSPERAKVAKRELLCTHVATASDCIEALMREPWDVLYLDHDLGGEPLDEEPSTKDAHGHTGMDVVAYLCLTGTHTKTRIVVHSLNIVAAAHMVDDLRRAGHEVHRIPFTRLLQTWRDQSAPGEWNRV